MTEQELKTLKDLLAKAMIEQTKLITEEQARLKVLHTFNDARMLVSAFIDSK